MMSLFEDVGCYHHVWRQIQLQFIIVIMETMKQYRGPISDQRIQKYGNCHR